MSNDLRADAHPLTFGVTGGPVNNTGFTLESGETPCSYGIGSTAWWTFTTGPDDAGRKVVVDTYWTGAPTSLAVWHGSTSLNAQASFSGPAAATITVAANTTYHVQVDSIGATADLAVSVAFHIEHTAEIPFGGAEAFYLGVDEFHHVSVGMTEHFQSNTSIDDGAGTPFDQRSIAYANTITPSGALADPSTSNYFTADSQQFAADVYAGAHGDYYEQLWLHAGLSDGADVVPADALEIDFAVKLTAKSDTGAHGYWWEIDFFCAGANAYSSTDPSWPGGRPWITFTGLDLSGGSSWTTSTTSWTELYNINPDVLTAAIANLRAGRVTALIQPAVVYGSIVSDWVDFYAYLALMVRWFTYDRPGPPNPLVPPHQRVFPRGNDSRGVRSGARVFPRPTTRIGSNRTGHVIY